MFEPGGNKGNVLMIDVKQAYSMVMENEKSVETETVRIEAASGRYLAGEVISPIDSPPFDKSAMDGYAISAGDTSSEFEVLETVAAGEVASNKLKTGCCIKIMTGAMLPEHSARVVRVEYTSEVNGIMQITTPEPYENIIRKGENLKTGDVFLTAKRLGPGDVGSLAASGIPEIEVNRILKVGIISTGSELRSPGEALGPGEIYNSNGFQIAAQIEAVGAEAVNYGIIPDDMASHAAAVHKGLEECDILLLSGGVSKGDFDYVPNTLRDAGVEIVFHGVKVKPGRPTLFGRRTSGRSRNNSYVFGLPGNPVSTFILFEILVKAFIYHLNGLSYRPPVMQGCLAAEIKRRDSERMEFKPVKIVGDSLETYGIETVSNRKVEPVRYMGSAHLNALVETDGLVVLEPGLEKIEKGALVDVRLI